MTDKKQVPFKVEWEQAFYRYSDAPSGVKAVAAIYLTYASADGRDIRPGRDALVEIVPGLTLSTLKRHTKWLIDNGWFTQVRGGTGVSAQEFRLSIPVGFDLSAEKAREASIRRERRERRLGAAPVEPVELVDVTPEKGGPVVNPLSAASPVEGVQERTEGVHGWTPGGSLVDGGGSWLSQGGSTGEPLPTQVPTQVTNPLTNSAAFGGMSFSTIEAWASIGDEEAQAELERRLSAAPSFDDEDALATA